jgi:hypothetical protein
MDDNHEETGLHRDGIPELVIGEADHLIAEAGAEGDPDALDDLAMDLLDGIGGYDQGAQFGLLLIDEIRRRASILRERAQ